MLYMCTLIMTNITFRRTTGTQNFTWISKNREKWELMYFIKIKIMSAFHEEWGRQKAIKRAEDCLACRVMCFYLWMPGWEHCDTELLFKRGTDMITNALKAPQSIAWGSRGTVVSATVYNPKSVRQPQELFLQRVFLNPFREFFSGCRRMT